MDNKILYNWYDPTIKCNPQQLIKPNNITEIINLIKKCNIDKKKIKFRASNHCWNDIGFTEGILLDMSNFNKIKINENVVIVECGVILRDLFLFLNKNNVSLYKYNELSVLSFLGCSIGGALSTGTHGSIRNGYGSFCSFIIELKYIDGLGNIKIIDNTSKLFKYIMCSLGQLCIILEVKLKILKKNPLYTNNFKIKKYNISLLDKNIFEFIKNNNNITRISYTHTNYLTLLFDGHEEKNIIPLNTTDSEKKINEIYFKNNVKKYTYYDFEYCFSLKNICEFLKITSKYLKNIKKKINIRITDNNEGGISPTQNNINCWCSLNIFPEELNKVKITLDKYKILISKIEKESLNKFKIYPHWGKINTFDKSQFKYVYGNNLIEFLNIKKKLDPYEIFENDFFVKLLK